MAQSTGELVHKKKTESYIHTLVVVPFCLQLMESSILSGCRPSFIYFYWTNYCQVK